jgi:heme oxygenase (mycobilin-producing)
MPPVRVLVHAKIERGNEAAFEAAFAEVARAVKGTPGHIGDELLRDTSEPGSYVLLALWESRELFLAWVDSPVHLEATTPIRPYWAGRIQRKIYEACEIEPD